MLLVFSFSRFLGVAEWSMFEWNQFNKYCKNIRIIEIKFTHWLFFHFFTSCTKRYGNKVIFLFFFMFSLFQKNVLASTIPLNELELFINCWDMTPFCIIIHTFSMSFILFVILLVLCNNITKCNHHGTCGDDGNCICDNGYYGPNCSSKLNFWF